MFLLDSLFISGMKFVFDKIAAVADAEAFDESVLHDRLLQAQVQLEAGEISDEEFGDIESEVFERLRVIRAQREGTPSMSDAGSGDYTVTGVEATFGGDEQR
jgi:hypothetical protein